VQVQYTGRPGRPRKVPNPNLLQNATAPASSIPQTELANDLGLHRHTLRNYLQDYGISTQYTTLTNDEVDARIRQYRLERPNSGLRYLRGAFRADNIRIQKRRLAAALQRVDPVGRQIRRNARIERRKYEVSRPDALWHLDGHHKLIRWGIVIHGMIDGYCRTVSLGNLFFSH
jgi:hypothetical protein